MIKKKSILPISLIVYIIITLFGPELRAYNLSNLFKGKFADNFWPDFLSTLLGIIIGLPIALLIDKIISSKKDKIYQNLIRLKLNTALTLINQTLKENIEILKSLIETLENKHAVFDVELDISAWDAIKLEIVGNLHDANIQGRVAYYFSRLASISNLNNLYLNYTIGTARTLNDSNVLQNTIREHMIILSKALIIDGEDIINLLETYINKN